MRASPFALIVLAAACSSDPASDEGNPCSVTAPCGDDTVCDFTAEGGPVCITRDGDLDGDGLTNDRDYCQHQAGGQFDEDVDGIGDECDRCPIAPPRSTPDSDTDNVDAPCDPAPSENGDEILLFDGFQNGLQTRWTPTTPGAWEVRPGELLVNLAGNPEQEYLRTIVVGKNSVAVEASYRVDRVETSAAQHLVAVYAADPRPAGVAQMQCGVTMSDTGTSSTEIVVVETNQGAMNTAATDTFDTANLFRAGGYVTGTRAGCSVLSNGTPIGTVQASITPDQLSQIALTARAASVRFQYVIVVGR